jgi:hypothetical protein
MTIVTGIVCVLSSLCSLSVELCACSVVKMSVGEIMCVFSSL